MNHHDDTNGDRLKEQGMAAVKAHNELFKQAFLTTLAALQGVITSDDVTDLMDAELPDMKPSHPNAVGACMNAAAKRGLIVATGTYVKTDREAGHSRKIQQWRRI